MAAGADRPYIAARVTGNDERGRATLTFTPDAETGGQPVIRSGSWEGANLVLDTPRSDGSLTKNVFVPASLADYNAAVKALG